LDTSPLNVTRRCGLVAAVGSAFTLGACGALDPYVDKFERVSVGDPRARVISSMGAPTASSSLQVPMVSLEGMTWRSPMSNKLYLVLIAMDRVVAKTAIQ
jgi:hypothetical protein